MYFYILYVSLFRSISLIYTYKLIPLRWISVHLSELVSQKQTCRQLMYPYINRIDYIDVMVPKMTTWKQT